MTAFNTKDPIFALDIGTRSVIGIIIQPLEDGEFEIKDITMIEHQDRSMLDGQIHDVLAVSKTISKVKEALEINNGPLKKVAVAAAGRSLKTLRVTIDTDIEGHPFLDKSAIRSLELSAVQEAQKKLIDTYEDENLTNYHCVGYSVVNYYLDNQIIGSLIDQRGNTASVEIIATFLPRVVVDSLISSLNRVGLELEALTLEPIAAIHILIPPSMRKINIAFVDIGAGTSDIAITAEGTVTAYGMVPIAGDEITEAITQAYLLDFHVSEDIKRQLSSEKEYIEFEDILGISYKEKSADIIKKISKDIDHLATQISSKILELNGSTPQAVILVGGGSQTVDLTERIARSLELPAQRVAVRSADAIQYKIDWPDDIVKGPDMVTPLGIGISSKENPINYSSFTVNKEVVHLFEMKNITVGDALIAAGIPIRKIIGKPGLALTVNINGKFIIVPGERGSLPTIELNGETADFDTLIYNGDVIKIEEGIDGKGASLTLEEALINYSTVTPLNVYIEGTRFSFKPLIEINGVDADFSTPVKDRDTITFHNIKTIEEALVLSGYSTKFVSAVPYSLQINQERLKLSYSLNNIYLNGKIADLQTAITNGDNITFDTSNKHLPIIKDVLNKFIKTEYFANIRFNGTDVKVYPTSFSLTVNGETRELDSVVEPNCMIKVDCRDNENIYFRDIFRYVDFKLDEVSSNSRYIMLINGELANFNSLIKSGDNIKFYWQ